MCWRLQIFKLVFCSDLLDFRAFSAYFRSLWVSLGQEWPIEKERLAAARVSSRASTRCVFFIDAQPFTCFFYWWTFEAFSPPRMCIYSRCKYWELSARNATHPKNPDPSKVANLRCRTPASCRFVSLPLEGPWGFLGKIKYTLGGGLIFLKFSPLLREDDPVD